MERLDDQSDGGKSLKRFSPALPRAIEQRPTVPIPELSFFGLSPRDSFHLVRGGSPLFDSAVRRAAQMPFGASHSLPKDRRQMDAQVRLAIQATHQTQIGKSLAAKLGDADHPDRRAIYQALVAFSSHQVAADEFERSCEYLSDLESIHAFLQAEVGLVLTMLPQNLPLYSLVLFVVVPALQAKHVVFHFPTGASPQERGPGQVAAPAHPVYHTVFTHLSRIIREVTRETFAPSGSESPTISRLRTFFRGGRVQAHPQASPLRLEVEDFGIMTHDYTLFTAGSSPLLDVRDRYMDEVVEAARRCEAAAAAPGDERLGHAASVAARNACIACLGRKADVVIFTGSSSSARALHQAVGDRGFLLVNGSGYNPVVVAPQPIGGVHRAARKVVTARLFNNGQDCAAPDAILVEESVKDTFLEALCQELDEAAKGRGDVNLPLLSPDKFAAAQKFITRAAAPNKHHRQVVKGTKSDILGRAMEPTVVTQDILSYTRSQEGFLQVRGSTIQYQEFYAPVFYVLVYREGTSDLEYYFNHGRYHQREMYVSCFGECDWVAQNLPRSVKLKDETVLDIDRGTLGYGGYGTDSTYAVHQGTMRLGPIQVPREISRFYRRRVTGQREQHRNDLRTGLSRQERDAMRRALRETLVGHLRDIVAASNAWQPNYRWHLHLNAAFLHGAITSDDFAPRRMLAGDEGSYGRSDATHLLVIANYALEDPTILTAVSELPAWLREQATWAFCPRSTVTWHTVAGLNDVLRWMSDEGPRLVVEVFGVAWRRDLLSGVRECERWDKVLDCVRLVEALAAPTRLWCAPSGDGERSGEFTTWSERATRLYGRWQAGFHAKLSENKMYLGDEMPARRWAQPRDIVVTDVIHRLQMREEPPQAAAWPPPAGARPHAAGTRPGRRTQAGR